MKKTLPIFIVVVLIVAGGSFFAGTKYGQSKGLAPRNFSDFGVMRAGQGQQNDQQTGAVRMGGRGNNGFLSGEIISKDDTSITVKLPDSGSKIIFLSEKTSITKSTDGDSLDLETGKTVMINGTTNSDGSLTATNIQIRPEAGTFQGINQ